MGWAVPAKAHPKTHRNPFIPVRMDLAHCAPAGRSQTNSFCVSLGAAASSLVSKPNILRVWLLWGSCTFHLELANQTNDWELISPNVELDKEYILHIIFTLSLSVIPCCIPCLLPLQAQLRINIRCLSLGKPEKKKKPKTKLQLFLAH